MPRSLFGIIALLFATMPAYAANAIPPYLTGIWATEGSILKGPLLFEGQAIYLGADGVGAAIGGPPPIGFKIVATFDSTTNTIEFDMYEGTHRGPHGSMVYDPKENTLDSGTPKHQPMRRRYETFTDETKRALGL